MSTPPFGGSRRAGRRAGSASRPRLPRADFRPRPRSGYGAVPVRDRPQDRLSRGAHRGGGGPVRRQRVAVGGGARRRLARPRSADRVATAGREQRASGRAAPAGRRDRRRTRTAARCCGATWRPGWSENMGERRGPFSRPRTPTSAATAACWRCWPASRRTRTRSRRNRFCSRRSASAAAGSRSGIRSGGRCAPTTCSCGSRCARRWSNRAIWRKSARPRATRSSRWRSARASRRRLLMTCSGSWAATTRTCSAPRGRPARAASRPGLPLVLTRRFYQMTSGGLCAYPKNHTHSATTAMSMPAYRKISSGPRRRRSESSSSYDSTRVTRR